MGHSLFRILRTGGLFGFIALAIAMSAVAASAHEIRPAIFTMDIAKDRTFKLSGTINVEALLAEIGGSFQETEDSPNTDKYDQLRLLDAAELESRFRAFAPGWMANMGLTSDGKPVALSLTGIKVPDVGDTDLARLSVAEMSGAFAADTQSFEWAHDPKYGSSVLRINRPGAEMQSQWYAVGANSGPLAVFDQEPRSKWQLFVDYLVIGFTHIVPKGLDHILFVLGLFLLSQNWRTLLAQVTAFTIAHSVTLGLGLYGIISLSPAIVEPLIALSIVYVAVENIFTNRLHVWRPVIVFAFGLLHGLGFAGILTEIGLPRDDYVLGLISFNVGVELGQIAVIVAAFVAVGWFIRRAWYHSRIVIPASLAIAAMGAWWFVERTFG